MADLWDDQGFGSGGAMPEGEGDGDGEDDWDEGEESMETALEDGFDDPDTVDDDGLTSDE